jgi:hypothetical protein
MLDLHDEHHKRAVFRAAPDAMVALASLQDARS